MQSLVWQFLLPLSLNLGCSVTVDQSDFQLHFSLEIKTEVLLGKRKSLPVFIIFHVCVSSLFIFTFHNWVICTWIGLILDNFFSLNSFSSVRDIATPASALSAPPLQQSHRVLVWGWVPLFAQRGHWRTESRWGVNATLGTVGSQSGKVLLHRIGYTDS